MYKETIKYVDFDGNEREKDCYFNINKNEAIKMQMSRSGGLGAYLHKILADQDWQKMHEYFEKFILASYGEKSLDGDRFIKSEELSKAFSETNAYDVLITRMLTDSDYAAKFFNAIIPQEDQTAAKPVSAPVQFPTV